MSLVLENLKAHNFRNLKNISLSFNPHMNFIIGNNGQGKTNILEAIALSCSLRTMNNLSNSDLISYGCEQAYIKSHFSNHELELYISALGKKAKAHGRALKSAQQRSELIPIVSFIPLELTMISGSAHLRRRALDQAGVGLYAEHYQALKAYDKIIAHRNRLLKSYNYDETSFLTYTQLLIQEGALIMYYRLQTLSALKNYIHTSIYNILGYNYSCDILYKHNNSYFENYSLADLKAFLSLKAKECSSLERLRKVSLFGPHLDDIVFMLNNLNAKTHSSRGEMRALVISFKLAIINTIFNIKNISPIIILDDIISELDIQKKIKLLTFIEALKLQSFFSLTDLNALEHLPANALVMQVENGNINLSFA
jgi:DNA replication and repair protein RecF